MEKKETPPAMAFLDCSLFALPSPSPPIRLSSFYSKSEEDQKIMGTKKPMRRETDAHGQNWISINLDGSPKSVSSWLLFEISLILRPAQKEKVEKASHMSYSLV
jgi:hypothetical protein